MIAVQPARPKRPTNLDLRARLHLRCAPSLCPTNNACIAPMLGIGPAPCLSLRPDDREAPREASQRAQCGTWGGGRNAHDIVAGAIRSEAIGSAPHKTRRESATARLLRTDGRRGELPQVDRAVLARRSAMAKPQPLQRIQQTPALAPPWQSPYLGARPRWGIPRVGCRPAHESARVLRQHRPCDRWLQMLHLALVMHTLRHRPLRDLTRWGWARRRSRPAGR